MIRNIIIVAAQIGVLFLLMGVGFLLRKLELMDDRGAGQMSSLLIYVVAPCVVIHSLQTPYSSHLMSALAWSSLLLILCYAVQILFSQLTFRKAPGELRPVLRFAQVYSNNGFMGLPLVQAVLGSQAVIFVMPSLMIFQLFQWTHGMAIMGGKISLRRMLLNPGIISLLIGVGLFVGQITLPAVLGDTVAFLANMNTPLAMVIIGIQMAGANFRAIFTSARLYGVALIKLLVAPAVTLLIMLPCLRIDPDLFCTMVILAAAPTAGMTSILAQQFRQDTATAAQVISLTTLLSLFTLPVFAVIAKTIAF